MGLAGIGSKRDTSLFYSHVNVQYTSQYYNKIRFFAVKKWKQMLYKTKLYLNVSSEPVCSTFPSFVNRVFQIFCNLLERFEHCKGSPLKKVIKLWLPTQIQAHILFAEAHQAREQSGQHRTAKSSKTRE